MKTYLLIWGKVKKGKMPKKRTLFVLTRRVVRIYMYFHTSV